MLFKEILGLEKTKTDLIRGVSKKRIAHSQLFSGPQGSGKLAMAIAYARFLNCESSNEKDSCGNCKSCIRFSKLSHPDFHIVFPVVKKSSSDTPLSEEFLSLWKKEFLQNPYFSLKDWMKAYREVFLEKLTDKRKDPVIYSHQIKEIGRKLSLKVFEAKYRVFLIWLPENMNLQAANKFLKLLEEPPKKTLLLLVSEEKERLINTVSSRLQKINIPSYTIQEAILQGPEEKTEEFITHCRISNGDMGSVLNYNVQQAKNDYIDSFIEIMRLSFKKNYIKISDWTEEISTKSRQDQIDFLFYSIGLFRECIIYNFSDQSLNTISNSEKEFLKNFAKFIHEKNSILIVDLYEEAINKIRRNANSKIIFFTLALKLINLLNPKTSIVEKHYK